VRYSRATARLPAEAERQRHGTDFSRRVWRYEALAADPRISARTSFFKAAAVVTRVLGVGPPSDFMARLSGALEVANLRYAERIRAGLLYSSGASIAANTAHFIRFEQALVQMALEQLRLDDAHRYAAEVEAAECALARAALWYARFRSAAHCKLHTALHRAGETLGHLPRFASQSDRERLGLAIASL
jgi:hypothetical protein